jgi:hypothetical protein
MKEILSSKNIDLVLYFFTFNYDNLDLDTDKQTRINLIKLLGPYLAPSSVKLMELGA